MLELYPLWSLINKKRHLTCDTHSSLRAGSDVQVLQKYLFLELSFEGSGLGMFSDSEVDKAWEEGCPLIVDTKDAEFRCNKDIW